MNAGVDLSTYIMVELHFNLPHGYFVGLHYMCNKPCGYVRIIIRLCLDFCGNFLLQCNFSGMPFGMSDALL